MLENYTKCVRAVQEFCESKHSYRLKQNGREASVMYGSDKGDHVCIIMPWNTVDKTQIAYAGFSNNGR